MTSSMKGAEAIVVGLDINGLGVVRSLVEAGIPTIVLDTGFEKPTGATRHGRKVRIQALEGRPLVDGILALASVTPEPPVLFLTQEQSVRTIAAAQEELRPHVRFSMPSADTVTRLMNKDGFMPIAEAAGLDVPRTATIRSASDLASLAGFTPPLIVKPSEHTPSYSARFKKAYVVDSADEAAKLYATIAEAHAEIIVQEWIPGGDEAIFFTLQYIDGDGELAGAFTGHKIVSWPPRVGGTAMCAAAPEAHERLNALTMRFFREAGFRGMGSLEFKRDPRTGRFYMIEPTVSRTDYQSEIATLNGVNLPAIAYWTETGNLAAPVTAGHEARFAWRDTSTVQGRVPLPRRGQTEGGIAWSAVDSLFRWSDPIPWMRFRLLPVTRRLDRLSSRRR
jgi:predicted ATP-grasp superfamily ATP-dependent carboligase